MTDIKPGVVLGNRIYWLDNLRTFMIFLVVLLHAGIVYESSGSGALFWIVDDPSTNHLSDILNLILDIVVMPTIFFVSGFFMPLSMKNKGGWTILRSRFKRLILPWIVAVITLMPLYKFIYLYSRNLPQENWTTYFHWSNGIFSQNWLWFLPVLFIFDILYFLISRVHIDISKLTLRKAIWVAFLLGFIYLVCVNIFNGEGWTKTIWIDFQNERLLIYFMIFLLGSLCHKLKAFASKGKNKSLYFIICSTVWIPVYLNVSYLSSSMNSPGKYLVSESIDAIFVRFSFLLSLLCLLFVVLNTFRYYLNRQGKIGRELNKNSYGVYIIHVIVLGGIAWAMLYTTIPSLLKFLILTVSTYAGSNLLVSFYRKFLKPVVNIQGRSNI